MSRLGCNNCGKRRKNISSGIDINKPIQENKKENIVYENDIPSWNSMSKMV